MVVTQTSVVIAGRYRLEGRIAFGGVGEVWRAVDLALGRPVAVKLLRAEYAQHAEVLVRFRAEARHAGSVSHPGIAQVYDYGEDGVADSPYLVMELVDGPSLAGVLAAGPLDPAATMDVLAQAAAGLQAAHAAGLVHRDVKPGNLLVGPATPASDLYALGVVGYQCLTGAAPFGGVPPGAASGYQRRTLPPLPATVPAGVAELVNELTAQDPAARPASAGQVAVRAGWLRDALVREATAQLASEPGDPPPAAQNGAGPATHAEPATLAGIPAQITAPAHRPLLWDRLRPRRVVVLAVAGVAAVAGLAGWLLGGAF